MVRRLLYILFVLTLIGGVVFFYWSYQKKNTLPYTVSPFNAIPLNASFLFKINNVSKLADELKAEDEMMQTLKALPLFASSIESILKIDSIISESEEVKKLVNSGTITLSWHIVGEKSLEPLFVFSFKNDWAAEKVSEALERRTIAAKEPLKYNGIPIYQISFPEFAKGNLYTYAGEHNVVLSPSRLLVQRSATEFNSELTLKHDIVFQQIHQTSGKMAPVNIYFNLNNLSGVSRFWGEGDSHSFFKTLNGVGSWIELDLSFADKSIMFNGFGSNANLDDYFELIKSQVPVKFTSPELLPASLQNFVVLGISNIKQFRTDYQKYVKGHLDPKEYSQNIKHLNSLADTNLVTFFDGLIENEIAAVYNAEISNQDSVDQLVVIRHKTDLDAENDYKELLSRYSKKQEIPMKELQSVIQVDYKTSIPSYDFPFHKAFSCLYGSVIKDTYLRRVCFYKGYILLAYDENALRNVLLESLRSRTLSYNENYLEFSKNLSEHSNFFWFANMQRWKSILGGYFNDSINSQIGGEHSEWLKFYALGLQLSSLNNLVYSNMYLHYNPDRVVKPKTVWESRLDTLIHMKPMWVINHNTGEKEICVQDAGNTLYLINRAGIVLWKKQLDDPIMGTIHQIDYFKNGKLQLLFNTSKKMYLLDRNGNYVGRYPVNFAAKATSGLNVMDYDNKKDYRIFVPCENRKIYLYDKRGSINKGWKFGKSDHLIVHPIKHFRADNRDFIVFKDKARLYIQDRRGRGRIKIKESFTPSEKNEIFLDKNGKVGRERFVTTDMSGSVKFIYMDGTVRERKMLMCSSDHFYEFVDVDGDGKGDHVFVDENKLRVFGNDNTELFSHVFQSGKLTKPDFYTLGAKNIKLGITDTANEKIYLFSSDGNMYDGFPLSGKTEFSIGFIKKSDWKYGLIVGGGNGYLYNYNVK